MQKDHYCNQPIPTLRRETIQSSSPNSDSASSRIVGLQVCGCLIHYRYKLLVKRYNEGAVSFRHCVFFQLEEYRGIDKNDRRSFAYQLYEIFFKYVDVVPQNVFFLNGTTTNIEEECSLFEKAMKEKGGIHLFVADVNSEASIGGNAPGSSLHGRTRLKTLTSQVLNDRSYSCNGQGDRDYGTLLSSNQPLETKAVLTMGLGNMMDSVEVIALFLGAQCARALHHVVEEPVANLFPASILQFHSRVTIVCERFSISTLRYTNVEYFVGIHHNCNAMDRCTSCGDFRRR